MKFKFMVEVEIQHISGKFASKDELAEAIADSLLNADEGLWYGSDDGEYETVDFTVNDQS